MDTAKRVILGVLVLIGVILALVGAFSPDGAGKVVAWAGVVAGTLEKQIDTLLGEEEVLRQQALDAIELAEKDIFRLQELAISSRVDAELLSEKLVDLDAIDEKSKAQLRQLAQLVESGETVTVDDVTWSPAELAAYAETKITEHETIRERIRTYEASRQVHEKTSVQAESALLMARQNVANMRASLELLDAKLALLEALQAEPATMARRSGDATALLGETESIMDRLLAELEREIRLAEERNQVRGRETIDHSSPLPDVESDALAERLLDLAEQN